MCDSLYTAFAVMRFTVCPLFSMLTGIIRLVVALFGESLMRALLPEAQVRPGCVVVTLGCLIGRVRVYHLSISDCQIVTEEYLIHKP